MEAASGRPYGGRGMSKEEDSGTMVAEAGLCGGVYSSSCEGRVTMMWESQNEGLIWMVLQICRMV